MIGYIEKYFCNYSSSVLAILVMLVLHAQHSIAQTPGEQLLNYNKRALTEKIYLHTDRNTYLSGDVIWFKLYIVDGTNHQPLNLSRVAYVEVLNDADQPVIRGKIAVNKGHGNGSFTLPYPTISGRYRVRAYTSWMKNFSADYYFHTAIDVINPAEAVSHVATASAASAYDVQFFPEGGSLVQGITSKVAFKLTDQWGRGVTGKGEILNQQGKRVATFESQHLGMGFFELTPASTQDLYTAVVQIGSIRIRKELPAAQAQGIALRLIDESPTQLRMVVQTGNTELVEPVLLLQHTRQHPPTLTSGQLVNGQAEFWVDKQKLPEGISHFTVFNAAAQPVCERLYFKAPQHTLRLKAATTTRVYGSRQRVIVDIHTTAPAGQSEPANVSIAAYRVDSLTSGNPTASIDNYLWLTSDLRGWIEQPEYYFTGTTAATAAADNLMLTQGWSRFTWQDVPTSSKPTVVYLPEQTGHLLQGTVLKRGTDEPSSNITVYLASPDKVKRLYNSVSKIDGSVLFEMEDFYGPREVVVQPNNSVDSTYYVVLKDPFSLQYSTNYSAKRVSLTPRMIDLRRDYVAQQVTAALPLVSQIHYRWPEIDSTAFYGKPDHSYQLDKYVRFKTMEEVMREYIRGVQVRNRKGKFRYMLYNHVDNTLFKENPLVIVDGVPMFDLNAVIAIDPLKIKQIDVVTARYFQGNTAYNGIVSYSTYQGDLQGVALDAHALLQTYDGLQYQREFYSPRYDTNQTKQSRLPDFRNLLYWNPEVVTGSDGKQEVEFYTSDQPGTYRVVVQGLSTNGLAGSTSYTFEVKKPL
ncbi:hypothetical protein H8B15_03150 [Hymenobacter sp. BT507]|uniref:Macroglobulin domain-containing protein n=1 Tax=Hymenobacter citatus TaxID=2763506 RepID=A0ABR7MG44_9BACT|nr:hypothetical protein [Hymenobacter citatus]MBC6609903.1 hypothetical protein [Hymenobacter citatus]